MPRLVTLATAGLVTPAFLHAAQRARRLLRRLPLCRCAVPSPAQAIHQPHLRLHPRTPHRCPKVRHCAT